MPSLYDSLHVTDPAAPDAVPDEISLAKLTGKDFSRAVVESYHYRESLIRRLVTDTLAPAVECRLLDHAFGKPVERIETEDKTLRLDHVTAEQLEQRALFLANLARQLRMNDDMNQPPSEPDDGDSSSLIH